METVGDTENRRNNTSVAVVQVGTVFIASTVYSKTCLKQPLKNRQNNILITNGSQMKVEGSAVAQW